MNSTTLKHWHPSVDSDNIAWLKLKYAEGKTNILSHEVLQELDSLVENYLHNPPRGVVILSGNSNGFIAGANIKEFTTFTNEQEAYDFLRYGQNIFSKLEKLSCPTVALINGFCVGGGLELSLACRYRIVLDDEKTRLGFPEVMLGIHPGWGGCERAPKLIGALAALDLILTGKMVNAKSAKKIGLVDAVVPLREFERAAAYFINKQPPKHHPGFKKITNQVWLRPLIANFIRRKLKAKVIEAHYPAPYAALHLWEKVGPNAIHAYEEEAKSVSKLILHPTTKNLLRVYFLKESLKKVIPTVKDDIKQVHVVGAGTMGGDIAVWCALQGYRVSVQDQQLKMLASTKKRAAQIAAKKLTKKYAQQGMLDRLVLDTTGEGVKHADVIIEAIPEQLALKQTVWQEIEKQAKPTALLATNTSSIPLASISEHFKNPQRLIGIHFFNPVAVMQLVEIVSTDNSDKESLNLAFQFIKKLNKLALPTRSSPGFLVNRILMPYLLEATLLLMEGVPAEQIDKALVQFGMPMGPITLSDTVGLDICLAVAEHLSEHYHWPVPEILRIKVKNAELGKKSGNGFYKYSKEGKQLTANSLSVASMAMDEKEIVQRCIMRLLNECAACIREKIVANADLVDAGMIFGTGFAPFLGGPMCYAKSLGITHVVQQLKDLEQRYGERFTPDRGWQD